MKQIETLVDDIYGLFDNGADIFEEAISQFGAEVSAVVQRRFAGGEYTPELRMSNLGTRCDRQLYYKVNHADKGEALPAEVKFKFLYGDILELVVLLLAREAGHTVTGCQDSLVINGVKGHRDAVIDGVTVDVKSASSFSFANFVKGLTPLTDKFGYLDQLNAYIYAGKSDPLVLDKDRGAFLVIDKTLGKIHLDIHRFNGRDYDALVTSRREMLGFRDPPPRGFFDEPEGKSGNRGLGTECSYCPFKVTCWPGLVGYAYSGGPKYLTHVEREPNVPRFNP